MAAIMPSVPMHEHGSGAPIEGSGGSMGSRAVLTELGRYSILGELASGGMATVYVARERGAVGFERIVAIKCCHEHLRANESFVSMFLEEGRLAKRIRHPNVVATLDVNDGPALYLIMEYVEGESLSALARRAAGRGLRLPLEVTLRIMIDALAGLQAAHDCCGADGWPLGLIHCAVSPQNILVGIDGTARITDFGIARAAARVVEGRGLVKGKLSHMAPEQLSAEHVTQRADIFSAGVVLWETLTGQALFCGDGDAATTHAVLTREVPAPSRVETSLPRALNPIVLRALNRDPAARFHSAAEFLAALEALPVAPATPRVVGEYVRREAGAGVLVSNWESGAFRKAPQVAAFDLETPVSDSTASRSAAARPVTVEMPTRVFEPPPELVAASVAEGPAPAFSTSPEPAPLPEAYRARRLIVAIALVLLWGVAGLLLATSARTPSGGSNGERTQTQSHEESQP